MIEDVNNKLREQIDQNASKEREQLVLNTKLLDIPQLTKQAQKSEEAKKKLETQMLDINLKCEQLEKINNSFTDKQLETQQKLENIRKEKLNLIEKTKDLSLDITKRDAVINELKLQLSNAIEKSKELQGKMDGMIQSLSQNGNDKEKQSDEYQNILLQQIKDKNIEIETLKQQLTYQKVKLQKTI